MGEGVCIVINKDKQANGAMLLIGSVSTLEDWKREMFEEIANSRDLSILTDGRKKKSKDLTFNNLISVEIARTQNSLVRACSRARERM